MKQLLFEIHNKDSLISSIEDIRRYQEYHLPKSIVFHLYCGVVEEEWITWITGQLMEVFPEAGIAGASSHAEIINGHLTDPVVLLSAMFFEKTDVKVTCFSDVLGKEIETGKKVCEIIDSIPDIKAAEFLIQGAPVDNYAFLQEAQNCRRDVKIFGGYPLGHDVDNDRHFIVHSTGIFDNALVLVTYAGEDFHIDVAHTAGWRSLGRSFTVTDADKNTLISVDGFPAANLYEQYLRIVPDENFMVNTMEFPLFLEDDGIEMLRHPAAATTDGTLALAGYVRKGMKVYMSYGDPNAIIADVDKRCEEVRQFEPEAVLLYTCTMRKMFWSYFINNEMMPFQKLATTAGFCTGGELNRDMKSGKIMWHNITLLSIAMREGEKTGKSIPEVRVDTTALHGQVGLVQRLTTLVQRTSEELRETLDNLQNANRRLMKMATTDGLTGLYNRREIEYQINEALDKTAQSGGEVALIMLDIDHFKSVNDTYGHEAGDRILEGFANAIASLVNEYEGEAAGRWGGEEFFCLLPHDTLDMAVERAEKIRRTIEEYPFPYVDQLTCSVGVTVANGKEDRKRVFSRVDDALYEAKRTGRNRVVIGE